MAIKIFRGDAQAVAQESRATPANVQIGDIFRLICNQKEVAFTATAATAANVTAGLVAAWQASTEPEHVEITATDMTTYVKLTAALGVPFTVTSSTTDGGGSGTQTLTMSTPTAATGPYHWDDADNWTPNGVPANTDDVILQTSEAEIRYGFAQSAVTLATLRQYNSFRGTLGLPDWNPLGYYEYRATELAIGATEIEIGLGDGEGSGRIKINTGAVQTTINVRRTGAALEGGLASFLWRGTNASNAVNVNDGSVGIGALSGQSATVATLRVGTGSGSGLADVFCGTGVTLTTVVVANGNLLTNSNVTTATILGGQWTHQDGTVTTIEADSGVVRYRSDGTVTTCRVGSDAEFDAREDVRPFTITNLELHSGCTFRDPQGRVTATNGFDLYRCSPADITWEAPPHRTYTLSAV